MNQRELVRRLRAAKWVDRPQRSPAPPMPQTKEEELAKLRELLRTLAESDRSIRAWEFVSRETKAVKLAENAATRAQTEVRVAELGGVPPGGKVRGIHGLA